jgi:AraC-like DNA-binding protein
MEGEAVTARPAAALAGLVTTYTGYRYSGATPGVHLGLPSVALTAIVSLDGPVRTLRMPDPGQLPAAFDALVGGLNTRPAHVAEEGSGRGISLGLTPAGCRSLLGMPVAEVGELVLPLPDLLGRPGRHLVERLRAAGTWQRRFAVLDEVLLRCRDRRPPADAAVVRAWDRLVRGSVRVADVAAEVGWTPRHLGARFTREHGLPPKTVARIARFERSRALLQVPRPPRLADVAAACGYADQAHLAREWNDFAEVPPSRWRDEEDLLFVQAEDRPVRAG